MSKLPFQRGGDGAGSDPTESGAGHRNRLAALALVGLTAILVAVFLVPKLLGGSSTSTTGALPSRTPEVSPTPSPAMTPAPRGPRDLGVVTGRDPFAERYSTASATPSSGSGGGAGGGSGGSGPSSFPTSIPQPAPTPTAKTTPPPKPPAPAQTTHDSVAMADPPVAKAGSYKATFVVDGGPSYTVRVGEKFAKNLTFVSVQTDGLRNLFAVVRYAGHTSYDVHAGHTVRF